MFSPWQSFLSSPLCYCFFQSLWWDGWRHHHHYHRWFPRPKDHLRLLQLLLNKEHLVPAAMHGWGGCELCEFQIENNKKLKMPKGNGLRDAQGTATRATKWEQRTVTYSVPKQSDAHQACMAFAQKMTKIAYNYCITFELDLRKIYQLCITSNSYFAALTSVFDNSSVFL